MSKKNKKQNKQAPKLHPAEQAQTSKLETNNEPQPAVPSTKITEAKPEPQVAMPMQESQNRSPTPASTNSLAEDLAKASHNMYVPILIAMVAGALVGFIFGSSVTDWLAPAGTIFIRLLKMIIVPLVVASLILGVLSLGDLKTIGRIGIKTFIFFTITTMLAIVIGLFLANFVNPGQYVDEQDRQQYQQEFKKEASEIVEKKGQIKSLKDLLIETVPTNPLKAMAENDMLAVIFFAVLFGIMLTTVPKENKEILQKTLNAVNDTMVAMVMWIMKLAPLGVFCLMAATCAKIGISVLVGLLVYVIIVVVGFIAQIILVYGPLLWAFSRRNLWDFLCKIWAVIVTAFSTSSSSATLPLTMRCAEETLKLPKDVSSFVVSLGCTINMNGTALYLGVATLFIAQVFNVELTISQQIAVLLVATASAIGTPGIPGGSLVFLTLILETVNIPVEGIALVIGVDRLLDMCRTTMNVMGDLVTAVCINATEKHAT